MKKNLLFSLKNWTYLCFFASAAMLLYIPIYDSVYSNFTLIIIASCIGWKNKKNITLASLCLSIILASVYGLIIHYHNQSSLFSMQESMGDKLYYFIWYLVPLLPLVYSFHKTNDLSIKMGNVIVAFILMPFLINMFITIPLFINTGMSILSIILTGVFLASAYGTKDNTTRNISLLASLGGVSMILYYIKDYIWYLCDRPDYYSLFDYDKDNHQIFYFLTEYYILFKWLFGIGCVLMIAYYIYIFKRSNFTLKAICITATIAFFLLFLISASVIHIRNIDIETFFNVIVYILFAFSFYKFNKTFDIMDSLDSMLENHHSQTEANDKTGLLKISYIYKWIGGILIALGLFLLFGSLIAAIDDENVTNEPMFGAFFLSGGIFSLFAGYLGEAIDDIRNNTKK